MPRQNNIQFRRGTYSQWDAQSTGILANGEPGFVSDFNKLKIGDGITEWSDLNAVNDALTTLVFNDTGSTISGMSVVYINGAQGDLPKITLSIASGEMTSSKSYGIVVSDISTGSVGEVVVDGALKGLNTLSKFSGVTPGAALWLSPTVSGGITTTKSYAPNHSIFVGNLIRVHQNQGVINVKIINGFELDELHNVAVTGATNGQFLYYNGASSLWQPNPDIYSIANNIGIGTNNPTAKLEVVGDIFGNTVLSTGYLVSNYLLSVNDFDGGLPGIINIGEFTSFNQVYWTIDQNGSGNFSALSVNDNPVYHNGNFDSSNIVRTTGTQTLSGNLILGGNLTVNGTTITSNVDTVQIEDPIITLGLISGNIVTNDTLDRGLALVRATGLTAFMGWDTSASQFVMLSSGVASNGSGNYNAGTYGDLQINNLNASRVYSSRLDLSDGINNAFISAGAEGDTRFVVSSSGALGIGSSIVTIDTAPFYVSSSGSVVNGTWNASTIAVNKGGTGRTSYSNGQILIGSGTSLMANTLTAGTGINITNGSGTITIDVTGIPSSTITNFNSSVSGLLPTISNSGDNRVLTSTGSTVGVTAESNLTFDGTTLNAPLIISTQAVGDEGGEIQLAKAPNGSLSGSIVIDSYQNKLRFFENGGTARGFYLDISAGGAGASTNIGGGGSATIVSNYADNRIITSDGTTTGLNAESNFTFNGSLLNITGSGSFSNNVIASGFIRTGGTNGQFLKADGSVDSTSYQSLLTNPVTGTGVSSHIAYWNSSSGIIADSGQLYWDSTNDRLGIGTSSPGATLDVRGSAIFNEAGVDADFRIEGDTDTNLVFVDASTDRVGIGTSTPGYKLQVSGSFGATTKSFRIDHPTKPGWSLEYGSLESPYHGVRLTGRDKVIKGHGTVKLPDYLKDLIHDDESITIQLTNYKHGKILYVSNIDLQNDQFIVKADRAKSLGELEFFWTLTGVRKDVDHLVVEKRN